MKVNHSVAGAAKRSVGKEHITGQSAELGPKNAVRLVAVLEYTLPPSQPTIEGKNELRPKWPLVAVCSRQNLNATHGDKTPVVRHLARPVATRQESPLLGPAGSAARQRKHRELAAERCVILQGSIAANGAQAGGGIRQAGGKTDTCPAADAG
jgi:hypothetical protein